MDAFEQIVAGLLRQEGYWTWNGYKINLTKDNKREIGKPTMPHPEIDILAYKVSENQLLSEISVNNPSMPIQFAILSHLIQYSDVF